jgi:hypothetical protein
MEILFCRYHPELVEGLVLESRCFDKLSMTIVYCKNHKKIEMKSGANLTETHRNLLFKKNIE